ncbi:MAG TPA: carboxypeptidase regulatory-like domain-containing protein [Solirubrobacterales bacterium]|nr:carboxypeptidase regulatory-like domain-containing protein [Solirubrobacterales bacterium]
MSRHLKARAGSGAAAALLSLALLLCLAALAPAAEAATGAISGTVIDAEANEPVEGVEVCAELVDEEDESQGCGFTETDGTYFIGGLDPGKYKVAFWSEGRYVPQYYDGKREWSEADLVDVLSATTTSGIDAALELTAGIEGTVRATEDGLGVEDVEVCAYPLDASEETFVECAYSGSDGSYEINGLAPGNYKVEFWTGPTGRRLGYQFWDHKSRFTEADVVSLDEGERWFGIDADLEPGAAITGNVSSVESGLPLEEVRVCAIDATIDKLTICTWTNESGNYGIRSLPGGVYKVVFSPEMWEFFPGQAFPGEEDDGFPTQFWSSQPTLAAANVLSLAGGSDAGGINARLGVPAVATPPTVVPPRANPPAARKKKKCRRGFRKKKVKGKVRCVKKARKHKRHKQRRSAQSRFLASAAR